MAGELRATLLTTVKGDAIKKLQKDLGGLGDRLKGLGGVVGNVAKGFAGFATAIGATKFITGSIEQAKLLEQTYRSLETVFGPLTGEMQKFAEGATKIGLSQTEAAKASIFIGGVLQQYGVAQDKAAESTQRLVSLAADLSFVYGYDVQEALLGMTALFRGEYDPIEKFGVAMKQNEIESIKAARGLGHLTGAAEMNADVLIRQELLFQRTGKSLGAFTENTDTLAVQSEVMRATFENLQATIGQELSPVITQFFSDLIPIIEEAGPGLVEVFSTVAEVLKGLADIFIDLFDPTTSLGESVVALGAQFESLGRAIFGDDFDIAGIFDLARGAIELVINAIHDLLLMIDTIILYFKAWGELIRAVIEADWDTVAKGIEGISNELYAARDAAKAFDIALQNVRLNPTDIGDTREIQDILNAKKLTVTPQLDPTPDPETTGKAVKTFFEKLQEEVDKQAARTKLTAMGASEGLVDAILGGGDTWKSTFNKIVKGGIKAIQSAQTIFNKTAAGIKEIEDAAKKADEALQKLRDLEVEQAKKRAEREERSAAYYNTYAQMLEAGYEKEVAIQVAREEYAASLFAQNNALIEQQKLLQSNFKKTAAAIFDAFGATEAPVETLGKYASAVADLRLELLALIKESAGGEFEGLFSKKAQDQLTSSLDNTIKLLMSVAKARDEVATQIANAQDELTRITGEKKSLFESIVDSIMGNVNITQIASSSRGIIAGLTRTLNQTRDFAKQIEQLKNMGLGASAIKQIIDAGAQVGGATAKALIKGGAGAIEEVNTLYAQIGVAANEIGSLGSSAMYDAGIETMQGIVDGLLSQQSEFEKAAEWLANAFEKAFNKAITKGAITATGPSFDAIVQAVNTQSVAQAGASTMPIYSSGGNANITININPGLVTDPVGLGREVVNAIQRYENTSGRVFARA